MKLRSILCITYLLCATLLSAQTDRVYRTERYIDQFKYMAISEMERSGIPASIKLAQGIHESASGSSVLAANSNNHFGIKCKAEWEGLTYYHEDDDYDKNGNLQKSCFRKYLSPEDSYIDHTDFLMYRPRYSFLFQYSKTDYKNWAKGLKKAGYATDRKYVERLLDIIDEFDLAQYDTWTRESHGVVVAQEPKPKPKIKTKKAKEVETEVTEEVAIEEPKKIPEFHDIQATEKSLFPKRKKIGVFKVNRVKAVASKAGDTPLSIAKKHNISFSKLLKYNELIATQDLLLEQYVFLQPKRRRSWEHDMHIVRQGETMYSISQLYGVRSDKLYERNHLNPDQEPAAGEKIILRGKRIDTPDIADKKSKTQSWVKSDPVVRPKEELGQVPSVSVEPNDKPIPEEPPVVINPDKEVSTFPLPQEPDTPKIDTIPSPQTDATNSSETPQTPVGTIENAVPLPEEFESFAHKPNSQPIYKSEPVEREKIQQAVVEKEEIENNETTSTEATYEVTLPKESEIVPPSTPSSTYNLPGQFTQEDIDNAPVIPPAPVRPPPDPMPLAVTYKVIRGDTLYNISRRYGTTVTQLRELNRLNSNLIRVGESIVIRYQ